MTQITGYKVNKDRDYTKNKLSFSADLCTTTLRVVSPVLTSPPLTSPTHLTILQLRLILHVQRGSSTTAASTSWYTFVTIFETHRELPHQQFFF